MSNAGGDDAALLRRLAVQNAAMWEERATAYKRELDTIHAIHAADLAELRDAHDDLIEKYKELRAKHKALGGGKRGAEDAPAPPKKKAAAASSADAAAPKRAVDRHCSVCKDLITAFSCQKAACVEARRAKAAQKAAQKDA